MRHSNHANRGNGQPRQASRRRVPTIGLIGVAVLVLVAGCGSNAASLPSPTPAATPAPTPDPHLKAPVTADQIYMAIASAHLSLHPNNALLDDGAIVKRINADLDGWPLRITAYGSVADVAKVRTWKAGGAPGRGEPPYTFVAMNVTVEFGPISGTVPIAPDQDHHATAVAILGILDPLLWPIEQHSLMAIPSRIPSPSVAPTPAPSKAAKTPSPKPTKKP